MRGPSCTGHYKHFLLLRERRLSRDVRYREVDMCLEGHQTPACTLQEHVTCTAIRCILFTLYFTDSRHGQIPLPIWIATDSTFYQPLIKTEIFKRAARWRYHVFH